MPLKPHVIKRIIKSPVGIVSCLIVVLTVKSLLASVSSFSHKSVDTVAAQHSKSVFASETSRICSQNPYFDSLSEPFQLIDNLNQQWLTDRLDQALENATSCANDICQINHQRFFPFHPHTDCKKRSCVGGECFQDTSKIVCGMDAMKQTKGSGSRNGASSNSPDKEAPCIVYSIGGNNQWEFELDILNTTDCVIHTFDCTGFERRFRKPDNPRLHFHFVCLGTENKPANHSCRARKKEQCGEIWTLQRMQQTMHHSRIDLLKIDIEGFEWPLLESWPLLSDTRASSEVLLPMQLLLEVHFITLFKVLWVPGADPVKEFKYPVDMVRLQERFILMGYSVVVQDDNERCTHCTELTLIRTRCPAFGVYALPGT